MTTAPSPRKPAIIDGAAWVGLLLGVVAVPPAVCVMYISHLMEQRRWDTFNVADLQTPATISFLVAALILAPMVVIMQLWGRRVTFWHVLLTGQAVAFVCQIVAANAAAQITPNIVDEIQWFPWMALVGTSVYWFFAMSLPKYEWPNKTSVRDDAEPVGACVAPEGENGILTRELFGTRQKWCINWHPYDKRGLAYAFLFAPLVLIPILGQPQTTILNVRFTGGMVILLYALPIAYLTVLFFGLPVLVFLRRLRMLNLGCVLLAASLPKGLLGIVVSLATSQRLPDDFWGFGTPYMCGLLVAATCWYFAVKWPEAMRAKHGIPTPPNANYPDSLAGDGPLSTLNTA